MKPHFPPLPRSYGGSVSDSPTKLWGTAIRTRTEQPLYFPNLLLLSGLEEEEEEEEEEEQEYWRRLPPLEAEAEEAEEAEAGFQVQAHFQAHSPRVQHNLQGITHFAPPPWYHSTTHRLTARCCGHIRLLRDRPHSPLGLRKGKPPVR